MKYSVTIEYKTMGEPKAPYKGVIGRLFLSGMLLVSGCNVLRQKPKRVLVLELPEPVVIEEPNLPAPTPVQDSPEDAFVKEIGEMAGGYRDDADSMGDRFLCNFQVLVDDFLTRERQKHIDKVMEKTEKYREMFGETLDESVGKVEEVLK